MAKLTSSLELSLVDHVSGPARRIDQNLENMRRQQMRATETFSAAAGAGAAGGAAMASAGTLLTKLVRTAVAGAPAVLSELTIGGPNSVEEFDAQVAKQGEIKQQLWDMINGLLGSGGAGPTRDMSLVMEDLRHEIELVKAEIAAVPPPAFDGAMDLAAPLRTNLARLEAELAIAGADAGQSLSDGFAGQVPGMASEMASVMARLRIIAASGITIPMRVAGPAAGTKPSKTLPGFSSGGYTGNGGVNDIAGLVHGREFVMNAAATSRHGALLSALNSGLSMPSLPAMPSRGGQGGGGGSPTFKFGDIHVSNPTNANPHEIARALGQIVSDRLRASHSNGGM